MWEDLLAFVGDNAEAKTLIGTLKATSESNVLKINDQEKMITDIKTTRDTYKKSSTDIKSLLGLEVVNEEAIKEAIKALKGGKGDEQSLAEIENLKGLLEKATNDNTDLKTGYEGKLQSMALDNALANSGLGANVANEAMYDIIANLARENAVHEKDTIVYKKADGTTIYGADNTPLTLEGRIGNIKADANYAGLFKVDVNSGTGTPPNGPGGSSVQVKDMSPSQKMAEGRK